jgi:hypothetical protein
MQRRQRLTTPPSCNFAGDRNEDGGEPDPFEYVWERGDSRAAANERWRRRVKQQRICTWWRRRTCGGGNTGGGATANERRTWGEPPCVEGSTLGSILRLL